MSTDPFFGLSFILFFFLLFSPQFFEDGEDGERKSSSTYLKEVMDNWEKGSEMFKSAEKFGGTPKSDTEEAPTEIDDQKAPPN